MRALLDQQLRTTEWDALVLDSINVAWAVPRLVRYRRKQPRTKIAYLAQNNETEAALELARTEGGWRRAVRLLQVAKTKPLERRLAQIANLVTADAPEDCGYLSRLSRGRPVLFVPPGYDGNRVKERTIDANIPRRAIIVGSFDWPPKRTSLEAFLLVAAAMFEERRIELQVIGRTDPSYVAELRSRFPTVEFTGSVPEAKSYMANARIGVVPDLLGGFKLKSLDYVFNRLPIFGIAGAVPGLALKNGEGIALVKTHDELAKAVVDAIDDFDLLNRLQATAFEMCQGRFDWNAIGYQLVRAVSRGNTGTGLAAYSARPASTRSGFGEAGPPNGMATG
jgi:glycosyltransferase involved in cell wall biosynthesis